MGLGLDSEVVRDGAVNGERILAGLDLWAGVVSTTSRAILSAAIDSFAVRGFHGTTLRHISEGSGLSTAALYVHFRSKEELLFEISRRGHEVAMELVQRASSLPSASPSQAMCCLTYAFTRWHAEQQTIARVVQYELNALSDEHAKAISDLRRTTVQAVRTLIDRGCELGAFDVEDTRGATAAVLSLGIDVARWYQPGGAYTPDELGRLYCRFAMKLLVTPEARPVVDGPCD